MNQYRLFTVLSSGASILVTPFIVSAQFDGVTGLLWAVFDLIDMLILIAFSLIFVAFFWGLAKYVFQSSNPDAKTEGKNIIIAGVIALFVATTIWGIIALIQSDILGDVSTESLDTPQSPTDL